MKQNENPPISVLYRNEMPQILASLFPNITLEQIQKLDLLIDLYAQWNAKINLISRKDLPNLFTHHILHSLLVARCIAIQPHHWILDLGTGGGLPGIPLAILNPNTQFTLVDATTKKINAVKDIIHKLGLSNTLAIAERVEKITEQPYNQAGAYHYVIARGVAPINQLIKWAKPLIIKNAPPTERTGLLLLKGGDIEQEVRPYKSRAHIHCLAEFNPLLPETLHENYEYKYLIHVEC